MAFEILKNSDGQDNPEKIDVIDRDFFIGVTLAVSSSIFIGCSFILKKISLLKLRSSNSLGAGAGGFGYLKDWIWWTGLISMGIGELLNLIAYGFAPASVVTPLGALSVLISTILASKYLQDHLTKVGKVGCVLCLVGSVVIILSAPREDLEYSLSLEKFKSGPVVSYITFVLISSFYLIYFIGPKYGSQYILSYVILCSQIGSCAVMASKVLALSIKGEIEGEHFGYQVIIISILALVICIVIQVTYLNKALDIFGTSVVTPIYYVIFTSFVLFFSAILFDEWRRMTFLNAFGTLVGLFIAFLAIFLLHAKKERIPMT